MSGNQIGTVIGVLFGCAWGIAGATRLPRAWRAAVVLTSILISASLIAAVTRVHAAVAGRFNGAIYGAAVAAEVLAIIIAAIILNRLNRKTFVPPVLCVIVGLHFLGLWQATNDVAFVVLAVGLCAIGAAAASLRPSLRLAAAGLGSAIALWLAAASTLA